jgi:hypothetical protein
MDQLSEIANKYQTDKGLNHHGYTPIYDKYFSHLRDREFILMELGFGGYQYPDRGGGGALMWAEYFEKASIITVDLHPKNPLDHERIQFVQASQVDEIKLTDTIFLKGHPEIIIDDASHLSKLTVSSFEILFPHLKRGGVYVVEDCHSSYWREHGFDGTTNLRDLHEQSTMNYFKLLADGLNYEHLRDGQSLMPWFHSEILSIHFYKQLIFIFKKQ